MVNVRHFGYRLEQFSKTALILLFFCLNSSLVAKELSASTIMEKNEKAMASLEDLQASATLKLQLSLGILPYSENLTGRYAYLKPDRHRLEFDDPPKYLEKAPTMFNWKLPSLEKYKTKVKGPIKAGRSTVYQIVYLPKESTTNTLSVLCTFDSETWMLSRQETSYRDGGSVALNFKYQDDTKLPTLDQVHALVQLPSYKLDGTATITLSSHRVNKGLDEGLFKEKTKS